MPGGRVEVIIVKNLSSGKNENIPERMPLYQVVVADVSISHDSLIFKKNSKVVNLMRGGAI